MYSDPDGPMSPAVGRLLCEIERLTAAGVVRLGVPVDVAAAALDGELRRFCVAPDHEAASATRPPGGWLAAGPATDAATAARVADVAFTAAHMLATEAVRHVADYLRHAEEEITGDERRTIDAVAPEAKRAIAEYRKLASLPPVT
jgi:hypothetical protein